MEEEYQKLLTIIERGGDDGVTVADIRCELGYPITTAKLEAQLLVIEMKTPALLWQDGTTIGRSRFGVAWRKE